MLFKKKTTNDSLLAAIDSGCSDNGIRQQRDRIGKTVRESDGTPIVVAGSDGNDQNR